MDSRWSDEEARDYVERYATAPHSNEDVALRVYSSRLIGREPSLVLHGGGNTSVKTELVDDTGATVEVLCVKGSGWNLGDIEPAGLPAVRLSTLTALRSLDALSDEDMVNAQRTRLLDASAPNPSVETLLHAFLPAKFIDHSHADAILACVDQPEAERICRAVFGDRLALVPYVMPGFALSKLAAEVAAQHPRAEGLLLLQHGLFTWGATARESYERHIRAVDQAERYIGTWREAQAPSASTSQERVELSRFGPELRGRLGEGERRYFFDVRHSEAIRRYLDRDDLAEVSQRGPVTPDHVIRTKATPLILDLREVPAQRHTATIDEALATFRAAYRDYFERQSAARPEREFTGLDPDPRVVLAPGAGALIGVGTSLKAASVAADLYEHTIDVIEAAEAIGRYQALPEADLFDMEYWSLEQAKLGRHKPRPLDGRIVYVSGAAGGIGAATARAFARAGASLYLVDREAEGLAELAESLDAASEIVDVSDEQALRRSVHNCALTYGGLDGVVSNAGFAPQSDIATCPTQLLEASFAVNFFAHHWLASEAFSLFERQGMGGFLLFNASKAAFNPGPKFGPYALPKAALVALTKQYALEGGARGIRANAVNADRIRTGLMSADEVERRAAARGLDVDAYFESNLLRREVTADDVAEAFVHLALAPSTTGCVLTVDGGNIAASPR
ncbi:4-formylbenzenesulfonate dehydrogenase TsaC1/TsaC2 [Enhygromyxa salina]|uniref:4-formylbenzenesulfonate dehydrogenase TsaC1/TsaC2 n=1 Tax=Enhygromyxa salina TaxID=215803 RepID=A0A2S9XRK1_9BACT|nr:bifunctional aldolase/short-chain dehydrogenase [Enhygromyxa salina]PRP95493.1 4-formylbenzenesulfonate dehydrogenase TsaC1/TsaC2 [Enhygromyxa salina]